MRTCASVRRPSESPCFWNNIGRALALTQGAERNVSFQTKFGCSPGQGLLGEYLTAINAQVRRGPVVIERERINIPDSASSSKMKGRPAENPTTQ